ncbi:CU044_5270 family protein [Streptomyces sp. NBC_00878]|uniref:CU044_5270 family protein n=1 Tax=Streptomyces sp. NBC_00878 TaxID=2975854 RepID=UPI002252CB76|nr:CU044_5270 family protein [Streptomyces sp. NBC_00878]MCX4906744.1 CU044_5270 family protein [Streptomyces sp. NBC_00878]
MNANTPRQDPAEWDQDAQLLSQTARDLPSGRHQFHKERLMAHIQQDSRTATMAAPERTGRAQKAPRFRFPRLAITLPATAAALSVAAIAGMVTYGGLGGGGNGGSGLATGPALTTEVGTASTKGVPQLLDQISLAAAEGDHPTVKPGQYVYIESKSADTFEKTVDDKTTLASHVLHKRQVWSSADGVEGWLIDPAVNDGPEGETLALPDELGNTPTAHMGAPSYDFLAKLPTDPDALLAKIYKDTKGQGNTPDQQAFDTIGDLLSESYPPAELYSALFKAAGKIPGVAVVNDAEDAAGRHGIAVVRQDETSGQREEWIFDKETHVYLGERIVQVRENGGDSGLIKPGTVVYTSAITNRAIVDEMKQVPSQAG